MTTNTQLQNIFDAAVADDLVARIGRLEPTTKPQWGKMNVGQMLAHCSKPFDSVYDPAYAKNHPKPNAVVRFLLKLLVKRMVVGPKPYKRNLRTAPEFIVDDVRDFEAERKKLIDYVKRVQSDGATAFDGKESHSFGPLTAEEWSVLFYKHTNHHLVQFGV